MKLTSLFAPLERLIEEHGSSAIQGKHIAFLKEQLAALKEQFTLSERRIAELEAENKSLRQERDALQKQHSSSRAPTAESIPMKPSKRDITGML